MQSLKMQVITEQVLGNISNLLEFIGKVRTQVVLLHDFTDIKKETKANNDDIRRSSESMEGVGGTHLLKQRHTEA